MQKMTIKDDLQQLKLIFSELHKLNSSGEYDSPFLFNFISVKNFWLTIRRNRNGKYCVVGKMPYHIPFQSTDSDRYSDCFFASSDLKEAQSQFYILGERLMALYRKFQ